MPCDYITDNPSICILLPCYNEEVTIVETIRQMHKALPDARIVMFDNNSTDNSIPLALKEGIEVREVSLQGKGNVVRRFFADIEADVYLMVDADTTYNPSTAPLLIDAIASGRAEMAVAIRQGDDDAFPPGHKIGNRLFNMIVANLFNSGMQDVFSGYRAFSRRFAKSFPAHSRNFEVETELSIFTLEQRISFVEIPSAYGVRPSGSYSKLHTFRDGFRILFMIALLHKELRPMAFFGIIAIALSVFSLLLGVPVILTWMETGLVDRLPTAVLSSAVGILSVLFFITGIVLDSVARTYREIRHMFYLQK